MIHCHEFNTRWWGAPVGLLRDPDFFRLSSTEQETLCAPYAWVEWQDAESRVSPHALQKAGFFWCDSQVPFQLRLRLPADIAPFAADIDMVPLDRAPAAAEVQEFRRERFLALPTCNMERVTQRFALWAKDLADRHGHLALEARLQGEPQGWFLAEPGERGLVLTLAMLRRDSRLSGLQLYAAALAAYADMGFRQGQAAFSVRNTDVLNLYARLGARFDPPRHCHFRLPKNLRHDIL